MTERHLHIISFDIPYPPDYGGVVDIYYRIKALSELGIRIHLHCYEYGRKRSDQLNALCASVNYYSRNRSLKYLFSSLPFIVKSRNDGKLFSLLKKDNFPVLMEGIHTTLLLHRKKLEGRKVVVRSHNIEHDYYKSLAVSEKNVAKKLYFKKEAARLEHYEDVLIHASAVGAISPYDALYIDKKFGNGFYLPAFHSNDALSCLPGKGEYALYHGNLSVAENNHAALYLVNEIFSKLEYPFIIAGNRPSDELIQAVAASKNITFREIRDTPSLQELIRNAQCNILATFQSTGVKLKLINALFNGRFCIVNKPMVVNTGLDEQCTVADTPEAMRRAVESIFRKSFGLLEWELRKKILLQFDNRKNAETLIKKIF